MGKWNRTLGLLLFGLVQSVSPLRSHAVSCNYGASVDVYVHNPMPVGNPDVHVTVAGRFIQDETTCGTQPNTNYPSGTYQATVPVPANATALVYTTPGLYSGMFRHEVYWKDAQNRVIQHQDQQGPVIWNATTHTRVDWEYVPQVVIVNRAGDGTSLCTLNCPLPVGSPPTGCPICTFRAAVDFANQKTGGSTNPVLVQFNVSPGALTAGGAFVTLDGGTMGGFITIDGTDSSGNPYIVGDANAAAAGNQGPFPRVLDLSGGQIWIKSSNNTIKGLAIKNTLAAGALQTNNVIFVQKGASGIPVNNLIKAVQIDGGNRKACGTCPGPSCGCSGARDLINIDNGSSPPDPNSATVRVVNVEGHSGLDKGVKAAYGGWAVVQDSWFHNNYRGGLQATLPTSGKLTTERNMIEIVVILVILAVSGTATL